MVFESVSQYHKIILILNMFSLWVVISILNGFFLKFSSLILTTVKIHCNESFNNLKLAAYFKIIDYFDYRIL